MIAIHFPQNMQKLSMEVHRFNSTVKILQPSFLDATLILSNRKKKNQFFPPNSNSLSRLEHWICTLEHVTSLVCLGENKIVHFARHGNWKANWKLSIHVGIENMRTFLDHVWCVLEKWGILTIKFIGIVSFLLNDCDKKIHLENVFLFFM